MVLGALAVIGLLGSILYNVDFLVRELPMTFASVLNNVQAAIGSRENGSVPLNGKMAELILYPSIQSSGSRTGINVNINAHYAIY